MKKPELIILLNFISLMLYKLLPEYLSASYFLPVYLHLHQDKPCLKEKYIPNYIVDRPKP